MGKNELVEEIKKILKGDPELERQWEDFIHITSITDLLKSFKILFFFIRKIIYLVEYVQAELGQLEKDERLEVVVTVLDDLIQFKGWVVWIEAFDHILFELAVSQVVAALDNQFGTGSWFKIPEANKDIDTANFLIAGASKSFGQPEIDNTG